MLETKFYLIFIFYRHILPVSPATNWIPHYIRSYPKTLFDLIIAAKIIIPNMILL
jgi:hypothetical protein